MKKTLLFLTAFLVMGSFAACTKSDNQKQVEESSEEFSGKESPFFLLVERRDTCYVVGYDGTARVDTLTGMATSGGYLLISENLKDSLVTDNRKPSEDGAGYVHGNLFNDIFSFPVEAMASSGSYCGFIYFQPEYRYVYKVGIVYRQASEAEESEMARFVNGYCYNPLVHVKWKGIVITSTFLIE